jgi:sulfite exporter TauE/SafE
MHSETLVLSLTAVSLGFVHTLLGPDHYVPFAAMARAGRWSAARTSVVTALSGLGHVLSSVLIGIAGVMLGAAVGELELIESVRGEVAGWLLVAFGFGYFLWGLYRAGRTADRRHRHTHADGTTHSHPATSGPGNGPHHEHPGDARSAPWILFAVFVLGPCEPLIPLLIYPAAAMDAGAVMTTSVLFGLSTITTMVIMALAVRAGISLLPIQRLERYMHALAGAAVALSGLAITVVGL